MPGYDDSSYGDSSYDDSSYGDSRYDDSSYGDSSYDDSSYGDSGYDDSDTTTLLRRLRYDDTVTTTPVTATPIQPRRLQLRS